jgi:membrane protein YdbS with pleckstrin-like domain
MTEKIVLGAVGLIVVIVAVVMTPDLIRYMKMRSM